MKNILRNKYMAICLISLFLIPVGVCAGSCPLYTATLNHKDVSATNASKKVFLFPVVRIGWNITAVQLELIRKGILGNILGYLDYDIAFNGPNGIDWHFILLIASSWKIQNGTIILAPIGRSMIYLDSGDMLRWTLVFVSYRHIDADFYFSGMAFGVVAVKNLEPIP